MDVAGTATADFLVPAGLRITNISRAGVGLSGVVRIGTRDTGVVQLYLPGTYELTTAMAQVSWFDRQGRVGLKFIEFHTIAEEWKPWFAGTSEGEPQAPESNQADHAEAVAVPQAATTSSPAAAAAPKAAASTEDEADYDLRKDLTLTRPGRASVIARRVLRVSLPVLLIVAATGAAGYWWMTQPKPGAASPSPPAQATRPPASPSRLPKTTLPKAPKYITRVQVTEGEPVLESDSHSKRPAPIQRGKPISRPEPRYPGAVPATAEEVALQITIDQKGTVNEVKVVRGNPAIAREVASAVGHWRYSPFFSNSSPVSVKLPVTIKFEKHRLPAADTANSSN